MALPRTFAAGQRLDGCCRETATTQCKAFGKERRVPGNATNVMKNIATELFLVATIAIAATSTALTPAAHAQKPADYRSRNFLLHTDLTPSEATELLGRLERMLALISDYWGRPLSGGIECYVVKDLNNWPPSVLAPAGRAKIAQGAGITLGTTVTRGNQFRSKSVIYAVPERGVPQHEAVHAYCIQTFGTTGPTWYAEGMAEMGQYWREGETSVQAREEVIRYLRSTPPKPLREIVESGQVTGDSWQNYAWRWALCHLLANNTNYAPRFRPLGLGLLARQEVSFEQVYGSMAREVSFEYRFFLQHVERGYRVDLCSWDWSREFRPLTTPNRTVAARVVAARGWQPTGLTVAQGTKYECAAKGSWKTSKSNSSVSADGDQQGLGRLVGIIMDENDELGEPFHLGVSLTFSAPNSGNLYVRCNDKWNGLHDNSGRISLKLNVAR
jgi:hypothetical protein